MDVLSDVVNDVFQLDLGLSAIVVVDVRGFVVFQQACHDRQNTISRPTDLLATVLVVSRSTMS